MATKMRAASGGNFEPQEIIPQGNHLGILYSLIEVGTTKEEFQGEPKVAFKASLTWELPDVTGVFTNKETGTDDVMPRVISKSYTLSAHEKSNLRKTLESWRGKKFTDKEAEEFDVTNLLGKPCLIQVVHTTKGDKTYANIAAITSVPKGMPVPEQFNPMRYLSYDSFDWDIFNALPKFLRELMETTPEFQGIAQAAKPASPHPDGRPAPNRDSKGNVVSAKPAPKPASSWGKPASKPAPQPEPAWEGIPDDEGTELPF
jgi:hypothetical protein